MRKGRIGRDEDIGAGLRRLLEADLAGARGALASGRPAGERVHRARQHLKRARSLVRVLAPAIGPTAGALRGELRDAARLLAGARDADAAAASARGLREQVAGADDAGFAAVVADLEGKARRAHAAATPIGAVDRRLQAVETALGEVLGGFDGEALLARAMLRAYVRGRKAMRRARSSLATPDLHGWRKEAKALWHILSCGRERLPARAGRMAGRLARLGDLLGLDHDHAILAEALALSPEADPSLMRKLSIIATERKRLEADAFALGKRIYRRRPRRFARRFGLR